MEGDSAFAGAAPAADQDEPAPTAYEQEPAQGARAEAESAAAGLTIEQAEKAQTIMSIASVSAGEAVAALQAYGWSVGVAAGTLLQGADSRKRKQPTSFDPTPAVASRAKPKKKPKLKLSAPAAAAPKPKPAAKPAAAPKPKPAKNSPPTKAPKDSSAAAAGSSAADDGDYVVDDKSGIVAELKVPLARVRRTVIEGDVKQVKPEALVLIAKATEMFVQYMAEDAFSFAIGAAKKRGGAQGTEQVRFVANVRHFPTHLGSFETHLSVECEQPTTYVDLANAISADPRLAFLAGASRKGLRKGLLYIRLSLSHARVFRPTDIVPPKRRVTGMHKAKKEKAAGGADKSPNGGATSPAAPAQAPTHSPTSMGE